jgi:hypothetical protein
MMFNRLKRAWRVLRTGSLTPERIYVYPAEYNPNRFVQLLSYHDYILALDAEGKVWRVKEDYSGLVTQEFLGYSPTRNY